MDWLKSLGKKKKVELMDQLHQANRQVKALESELAGLQAFHKALVVEKVFWQNQSVAYGEQVAHWMQLHRDVLAQMAKASANVDLQTYANSIAQALRDGRPDPSMIAAALAMSGKDHQGAFTSSPSEIPELDVRLAGYEPRVGTPERKRWQDEKNRQASALIDAIPGLRGSGDAW